MPCRRRLSGPCDCDSVRAGSKATVKEVPNAWGLYDMNGNLREWCLDWFGKYSPSSAINPTGPSSGEVFAVRGGCYAYRALDGRSSTRFGLKDGRYINRGFRVVLEVDQAQVTGPTQSK
ncbi:MAG: formylglycine-rating sulfatase enzyme [Planctomycetaceae bacterium]|nr:formylglycine-rating sulfatase enzyme [Planctomycetaceae bacterium]